MPAPTAEQEQAIRDAVARGFDDQVRFLQELVATPSRRTDEADAQRLMARAFEDAAEAMADTDRTPEQRWEIATSPQILDYVRERPLRDLLSSSPRYPLGVEREAAGRGAWYEFFPRSEGATYDPETGEWTSGTFRTATAALDRAAAMGFDVAYLPPIHPIGRNHRKGPNNTLTAGPQDPGSPWAIGGPEGGHDTIHPDLGSFEDFDAFVAHAHELVRLGADIIDVGAESTRPGATRVPAEVEAQRIRPVIRALHADGIRTSVDTMRAATALAAAEEGVDLINDVSGGLADADVRRWLTPATW